MTSSDARALIPSHEDLQRSFYLGIIFEVALTAACKKDGAGFDASAITDSDSLLTQYQAFQSFVNKLAQVCDNERGGKTITSISVLRGDDGPEYLLSSNQRTDEELTEVTNFLFSLLRFIGMNQSNLRARPLAKQVLWKILFFNLPRIGEYIKNLKFFLGECIADCQRKGPIKDSTLEDDLFNLKIKASFPQDALSFDGAKDKFLSDCETLIKSIHAIKESEVHEAILTKAKDGEFSNSEAWCGLRHYLGRLLSYRQATEVIVAAARRWEYLFNNIQVEWITSSEKMRRPIQDASLTAEDILRSMSLEKPDLDWYIEQAGHMQKLDLDGLIQKQIRTRTFRPYVHAEVHLHNELLMRGIARDEQFWNGWKYIGTSKPTCRLCAYYFNAHPDQITVRPSHRNLYPNWRLPDMFVDQGPSVMMAHVHILQIMRGNVQADALRVLRDKVLQGKRHDSNSSSALPGYFFGGSNTGEILSMVSNMSIAEDSPRSSLTVLEEDESDDGGEGGGVSFENSDS